MEVNDEKDLLIYALVKKLQQASFSQVRLLHHIAGCVCSHQFTDDLGKTKGGK